MFVCKREIKPKCWIFAIVSVALMFVAHVTKSEHLKESLAFACVASIWIASFGIVRTRNSAYEENGKKPSKP
jgi:hypothetical protein